MHVRNGFTVEVLDFYFSEPKNPHLQQKLQEKKLEETEQRDK